MRASPGLLRTLRHFPRRSLAAGAIALVVCAALTTFVVFRTGASGAKVPEQVLAEPTATVSPTPVPDIERLIIPAIKLDTQVIARAVDPGGEMPSPEGPEEVIWYDFSALPGLGGKPGAGGNAVLAGHFDYHGIGPAVFWDLQDIQQGDEITVRLRDGSEYKYVARSNRVVDPSKTSFNEIVAATSEESLTVITCAGDFDPATDNYNMRRVVWAVRVG